MSPQDSRSIVTLCLMAAFVDGQKHDREREEVRRIAESLAQAAGDIHLPTLYQDVLMKRQTLASVAASLQDDGARHLAYEMAVCVCDADGSQSEPERAFLRELREALKLSSSEAQAFDEAADAVAQAPLTAPVPPLAAAAAAGAVVPVAPEIAPEVPAAPVAAGPTVDAAALDKQILNASIMNGALELLPESLSTLAIIPLQMRLVYGIGKAHGYELDSGHIKDFLATVGVGLTSQYLEQAGRKLIGGLLGKVGGGLLRGVGKQAVSSGMSFATTYALGHVAKRYYGSGRQLSTQMLKDSFAGVVQQGEQLQTRYLPQIQEQARSLDTAKVLAMVRGR
ncbi:YcjF family protein [Xenophilus sp. Marseille-Q4582]|uniref:YcjF family protein n=1 Tax=Xenophilus sp. Marseille-Q4582 TaxID=2866600 RepID=UPI001CE3CEEC|nr:DUF533 domain-containing protein [Xenophilus sp. Marseille-Q4582]